MDASRVMNSPFFVPAYQLLCGDVSKGGEGSGRRAKIELKDLFFDLIFVGKFN